MKNTFALLDSGEVNTFQFQGYTFIANNLKGHWEVIHIGEFFDPSAYYPAPVTSMDTLYKIAADLLENGLNIRYGSNGKIDGIYPIDEDNKHITK